MNLLKFYPRLNLLSNHNLQFSPANHPDIILREQCYIHCPETLSEKTWWGREEDQGRGYLEHG